MAEIYVEVVPKRDAEGYLSAKFIGPESFESRAKDIADGVASVANSVRADLERALHVDTKSPYLLDTIELKFTIDLEAEAGVVIARARRTDRPVPAACRG